MKTLGITGGIGAGKSTVAGLLRQVGVLTVDTDEVARQVVEPGSPALKEIERVFGDEVLNADGSLQRERMAQRVFGKPDARAKLEAILHPRIHSVWQAEIERWRRAGREIGAVIIPLLFEKDLARHFSLTICVACSVSTQKLRLLDRGWPEEGIGARLESQYSMQRKVELSHRVLWNEGPVRILADQLNCVLKSVSQSCPGMG